MSILHMDIQCMASFYLLFFTQAKINNRKPIQTIALVKYIKTAICLAWCRGASCQSLGFCLYYLYFEVTLKVITS